MPKRSTIKIAVVIATVLIVLILLLRQIIIYNQERSAFEEKTYDTLSDFETIQEVAMYLDCEYIKQEKPDSETFNLDIYLKFKYDLYTDGASNQEYFYRAAILFSQVTNYGNIRLIDDSRELVIAILGDSKNKKITKLYINGNDNYYGEQDTIQALENYKATNISRIEIQSNIIKELIEKEWKAKDVDFGTKESTFDGYDIYFDEGIEVKTTGRKVFNIVFTEKYTDEIVNGIKVNTENEEIVKIIGNPGLGKTDYQVIGYKGEKIYIFFEKDRVSIYPVEKIEEEQQFLTLIETYRQTQNLKSFVSGITDLWPDYDKYDYDSNYVDLQYILKGIKIQFNTQRDNGVSFYGNYNGSYINDLRQNKNNLPEYTYFNNNNLIYLNEQSMYSSIHNYTHAKSDYEYIKTVRIKHNSEDMLKFLHDSSKFFVVDEYNTKTLKVIPYEGEYPAFEIENSSDNYFWLDDITLAYSVKNKGIYACNAETREISKLAEGTDEFKISNYQNGILYYDDKFVIYGLINQGMDSYIWLNNTTLAYSIKNQGIYVYDIITQETNIVIEGMGEFKLGKYENGRLYYDNSSVYYIVDGAINSNQAINNQEQQQNQAQNPLQQIQQQQQTQPVQEQTNDITNNQLRINNTTIIYSVKNQGIYAYDLVTQETTPIIEGNEEFNLVKYENGKIYYDNKYIFYIT